VITKYAQSVIVESYEEMARVADILLEALVQINVDYLQRHPFVPPNPIAAGIYYDPPPLSFRTSLHPTCSVPVLLARGRGKCDSIAAYDVAGRRIAGQTARVAIEFQGDGLFHVMSEVLVYGQWKLIDISQELPRYENPQSCSVTGTDETCDC